jgi:hypothetical protein
LVPISQFGEWYFNHPIFCSLLKTKDVDLLPQYGLWAFCAKCYHAYKSTILDELPMLQTMRKHGGSLFFTAKSEESAIDLRSLASGHCPSCGHENLIAIMTDIPAYVREVIKEWERSEEEKVALS